MPAGPAGAASPKLDSVDCAGVDGENIVAHALRLCREDGLLTGAPLHVKIEKHVPVAAGMGGGSADAAAMLRLVAELQDRPLSDFEAVAFSLGADVPSQLRPGAALVLGAGERVVPVDPRCLQDAQRAYVIVAQSRGLATADVFAHADRLALTDPLIAACESRLVETVSAGLDLAGLCALVENSLEPAIVGLRPELAGVCGALRQAGAITAAFTGSGPTCFGVFSSAAAAGAAAEKLSADGLKADAAIPVGREFAKPRKSSETS
jgi:4-diphosphocytidyl-2-C-methyl-D-erythritol kinase